MDLLIFPHQLYRDHPGFDLQPSRVVLIEDSLFFGDTQYPARFHQQKLWLHRATMKRYESQLRDRGFETLYLEYETKSNSLHERLESSSIGISSVAVVDPVDFALEQRITRIADEDGWQIEWLPCPGFLNTKQDNEAYRNSKTRWFMADFYKWQRIRLDLLMEDGKPCGGQWSFDDANRKKVPKKLLGTIPSSLQLTRDSFDLDAKSHVELNFPDHPGHLQTLHYPTSHEDAEAWLRHFLNHRLNRFGDYEDAIVEGESWLWHGVLTPAMNIGLLTPKQVVEETIKHAERNDVPINSLEGFLRQIIGWREFMRATYEDLGVSMRTTNHWRHHRPMPASFYDGTTGIPPIDDTIRRILQTGYCHHIERLMVLGGFMFLCEIEPDQIYRWFMEMFVDSYDWVMVTNVYAMSQNADGGQITTKPYFSGSSYIRKMSHHRQADWCKVWDGLYWRWIWNHADELAKNPRWSMMCHMIKKMDTAKREEHLEHARIFMRDQAAE